MPVNYKRQDELEKLFETFAHIDQLEEITFPEPKPSEEAADEEQA